MPVVEETPTVEETSTTEETPVIVEEPVVEEPMVTKTFGFDLTLEPGLNMISIPLMPEEPYTAKSLAAMLEATLVIRLDLATQSFSAYTTVDEGTGFSIDGGKGYIVNTPTGGMVKFTGTAWDNQPEIADNAPAAPTLSTLIRTRGRSLSPVTSATWRQARDTPSSQKTSAPAPSLRKLLQAM